ncbi:Dolichyl-phosphate-mannose--protein mannosyltransferase 1 [Basidiobolus ranarum]|uniref:Dolichyl-phosphate-mannose--protein mannosyltransferase 1 n=1 Tax=Basidiobolus ranarum TaxID=34480 RepID=A0ABR2VMB9_9FUNG
MVVTKPAVRKRNQLDRDTDLKQPVEVDDNGKMKSRITQSPKQFAITLLHVKIISIITVIAAAIRFYRITQPDSVVFDEVHFGGFASQYINREFFMDVHPPLAKMMIAAAGYFSGFDGVFSFEKIGMSYVDDAVPYVSMRLLSAVLGWLLVPIAYFTLRAARCSHATACLGALLIHPWFSSQQ